MKQNENIVMKQNENIVIQAGKRWVQTEHMMLFEIG